MDKRELDYLLLRCKIEDFLYEEAQLLDTLKFNEWLNLLSSRFEYKIFCFAEVQTDERGLFQNNLNLISEDGFDSITIKIKRLGADYAWSELPPSKTLRNISNVRIVSPGSDIIKVHSNISVFKSRRLKQQEIISAFRDDEIVETNGSLKLQKRHVIIPETVLEHKNLSLIL